MIPFLFLMIKAFELMNGLFAETSFLICLS